jgi:hypothetical protein
MEIAKNGDFSVDLGQTIRIRSERLPPNELDGNLDAAIFLPTQLDFSKLALPEGLPKDVLAERSLFALDRVFVVVVPTA